MAAQAIRKKFGSHLQEQLTKQNATILDGSTGYGLLRNGLPEDDLFRTIWSARALVDEKYHGIVVKTHKEFLEKGAQAITTNTYATQPTFYKKAYGKDFEKEMLEHAELAAKLAAQARDEFMAENPTANPWVFGSLPPLIESHRPDMFRKALAENGDDFFIHHYKQLAEALQKGGVDALLLETLNCWEEAYLCLQALEKLGVSETPIIVCLEGSLRDDSLKPQTHLAPDIVKKLLEFKSRSALPIVGLGWNCAPPEDILETLEALHQAGSLESLKSEGISLAAYANMHERKVYDEGFEVADVDASDMAAKSDPKTDEEPPAKRIRKRTDLVSGKTPYSGYVSYTTKFVKKYGVSVIGGCCGCDPSGIEAVKSNLC